LSVWPLSNAARAISIAESVREYGFGDVEQAEEGAEEVRGEQT
jgi:hypothetical protein